MRATQLAAAALPAESMPAVAAPTIQIPGIGACAPGSLLVWERAAGLGLLNVGRELACERFWAVLSKCMMVLHGFIDPECGCGSSSMQ